MTEQTRIQKMPKKITREEVDGVNIKYIPNTDDLFAVSRDGMCWSFSYKMQGRPIGTVGPGGYITCSIQYVRNNPAPGIAKTYRKTVYVHRLIAEAFIPNPEQKKQIAHINEDKTDNRVSNLCWATAKENCDMGSHNEKLAASIKQYYVNRDIYGRVPKRVVVSDKNGVILEIAPSIKNAADWIMKETGKDDNASAVQISAILLGKPGFKTVGGYCVKEATEDQYQAWTAQHMNGLLQEEDVEVSKVQLNKLSKIDGVRITNRRMDPKTGELECEVQDFERGEKIVNELH